jgi:hypothetical protein
MNISNFSSILLYLLALDVLLADLTEVTQVAKAKGNPLFSSKKITAKNLCNFFFKMISSL